MEPLILYNKLMDYGLWLLAKRAYTVYALEQKLIIRAQKLAGPSSEETNLPIISRIIERFKELSYIDDLRFCTRFVEERSRLRPRGRYGLTQELLKKGVFKKTIDEFWESEQGRIFDEIVLAKRLLEKRGSNADVNFNDYSKKQKIYRFLASKGFSVHTIHNILRSTSLTEQGVHINIGSNLTQDDFDPAVF